MFISMILSSESRGFSGIWFLIPILSIALYNQRCGEEVTRIGPVGKRLQKTYCKRL
jgi:hypothetical protein